LCLAILLYVPIVFYVFFGFYHIFDTILDPATVTTAVDGHMLSRQNVSLWGQMGMIILESDTPTFNTSVLHHKWKDYFDQLPDTPDPFAKVMPVPRASDLFPERAHRMVVVNTSMLVPRFTSRTIHHVTPFLELRLTFLGPPRFNIFTAPESLTADKLNTLAVEGFHYHDAPLTSRCQAFLSNKGTYSFFMQKEMVPREGHIAWGLPWSGALTRSRYYVTGPFAQEVPNATSYRLLFFPTPMTVRHIVPLTVFGQASACLTTVGAFMALVHLAYNAVFRRKHPLTKKEQQHMELTLKKSMENTFTRKVSSLSESLLPDLDQASPHAFPHEGQSAA